MKLAELQQELREVDPAAILVPPRILERVIRLEFRLPNLLWNVPHRKCYVVDRHVLFRHVEEDELDLEPGPDRLLPPTVILMARPTPEQLHAEPRPTLLLKFWRRLFHANVHVAMEHMCDSGKLTVGDVRKRIEQLGQVEFEEIRRVLIQDNFLQASADDRTVYVEFVAVFLELHYFAASSIRACFPAVFDVDRVRRLLLRDVDAETLFARTRLAGAPDPVVRDDTSSDESHDFYWKLARKADKAAAAGNVIGAAILRTRAARVAPANLATSTRERAESDLETLVIRLQAALGLTNAEAGEWLKDLPALLDKADQGLHPVEASLLHDLQTVCLDHEQDIYKIDLVEWLLSAGKRPIKRPLPSQRLVRVTKHLRNAANLLTRARLSDADRQHLRKLLETALGRSEQQVRERFRPILSGTLSDVGLRPSNPPERAAFHKTVEELLDRIIDYGFLTFSDLRDAISRNQLKLPDLAEAEDFVRGDPLLRLDRRLATLLDGVYRPAEFYLRWLERFTALNFGTAPGRAFTRYVTLPFGGAFIVEELSEVIRGHFSPAPLPWEVRFALFFVIGCFFFCLMHVDSFRQRMANAARQVGRGFRQVFIDLPTRVLRVASLRQFLESWPVRFTAGYLIKPLAVCGLLAIWLPWAFDTVVGAVSMFLAANFVLNSRPGLAATDGLLQGAAQAYDLLRAGLLPGLFRLIVSTFKQAIEMVEYVLFTVSEWLRFRSGETWASIAVRAVLTVVWFPIAYLARFYIVVLIEPGFNPLKAPVSYTAAKFMAPFYYPLTIFFAEPLYPLLGETAARAFIFGGFVFWFADGFGFLFWEMKENWGLYRANRAPTLRPVLVGSHGETVKRLLQPGFHSGTLPKLYTRLRHAEHQALQTGNWQAVRVYSHELQGVERAVQRLLARDVVVLIQQSPHWKDPKLSAGRALLASNRISLELVHADYPDAPVRLDIDDRASWLVAGIRQPGWLDQVTPEQRQAVTTALAGLYKLAGVDLVREQIEARLPSDVVGYDITERDLVLWLNQRGGAAVHYEWSDDAQPMIPRNIDDEPLTDWPVMEAGRVMFAQVPITWERWVDTWQRDQEGQPSEPPFLSAEVRLLPVATTG